VALDYEHRLADRGLTLRSSLFLRTRQSDPLRRMDDPPGLFGCDAAIANSSSLYGASLSMTKNFADGWSVGADYGIAGVRADAAPADGVAVDDHAKSGHLQSAKVRVNRTKGRWDAALFANLAATNVLAARNTYASFSTRIGYRLSDMARRCSQTCSQSMMAICSMAR
jgi:hypothetical protein